MAEKTDFKLVHRAEEAGQPPQEFDAAEYFKEVTALRKPLQPVIRKAAVTAEVHVGRPHADVWFQANPGAQACMEAGIGASFLRCQVGFMVC